MRLCGPLPGVLVFVDDGAMTALTDTLGLFALTGLSPGATKLRQLYPARDQNVPVPLNSILTGFSITDYRERDKLIELLARAEPGERRSLDEIASINVPEARMVYLLRHPVERVDRSARRVGAGLLRRSFVLAGFFTHALNSSCVSCVIPPKPVHPSG